MISNDAPTGAHPPDRGGTTAGGRRQRMPPAWRPALVFFLLAAIALASDWLFFAFLTRQQQQKEWRQLSALARLKGEQIEYWLHERRRDAEALAADAGLRAALWNFLQQRDAESARRLNRLLESSRALENALAIELLDPRGGTLLLAGQRRADAAPPSWPPSPAGSGSPAAFVDLQPDAVPGAAHFSFVVPLHDPALPEMPPRAYLRLLIAGEHHLFPLLRAWPLPGSSGETLLVRRDGDALLYLSEPAHPTDAGWLRRPLRRADLPGNQPLFAAGGPHGGVDYRGRPALTAAHPVAGTPWVVLAEAAETEALAPLDRLRSASLAAIAAAFLAAAALRRQSGRRRAGPLAPPLQTPIDDIAASLPGVLCSFLRRPDGSACFPYASPAFSTLYGFPAEEVAEDASPLFARVHPEDAAVVERNIELSENTLTQWHAQFRYHHPQRGEIWIEGRSVPHRLADGATLWHGYVYDITECRRAEEVLEQARARYRGLLDNIPGAAFRCELRGPSRVVFVSDGVQAITGHTATAFLKGTGLRWSDIALADDLPAIRRAVGEAVRRGGAYQVEYRIRRRDGQIRWVYEKGRALDGAGGRAEYIDGVLIDISARVAAEAAAQASGERWRQLAEAMPQLVWTCRADACCDYVNGRWIEYTGLSAKLSASHSWLAAVHPEEQLQVSAAWHQATARQAPFECECRLRQANGDYLWFKSSALPVPEAGGGVKWYGSSTDIEDIKEFEAALQRSLLRQQGLHQLDRAILEASTPEEVAAKGLAHLAALLPFAHGNARAFDFAAGSARVIAVHDRQADGVAVPERISLADFGEDDLEKFRAGEIRVIADLTLLAARAPTLETIFRAGLRSCLRVPLLAEGRLVGSLSLAAAAPGCFGHQEIDIVRPVADVLAIALQQAFLRQHLAHQASLLEKRVAERTAELARMKDRAEAANLAKSRFLSRMAQQLRIPLNSLLILSQLLADNTQANLTEEQVGFARVIHDAGGDLLGLINDILDLSNIESGRAVVTPRDLPFQEVLAYLERVFRPQAASRGLAFELYRDPALPASLCTDVEHLQPVLRNLLANAVKFTHRGSIRVGVEAAAAGWSADHPILSRATGVAAFVVADSGVGIAADQLPMIFDLFAQAAPEGGQRAGIGVGGTGLGLHIARSNAALLGGELTVSSTPGAGSTFTLFLPLEHLGPASPLPPG